MVQGTPGADKSDKGAEQDGGNNPDGSRPFAIPTFYNVTLHRPGAEDTYTGTRHEHGAALRDNAGGR